MDANALPDDLIDTTAAAKLAKVHVASIFRWCANGKLRYWRRVGRRLVSRAEVLALFEPGAARAPRQRPQQPAGAMSEETERFRRWLYGEKGEAPTG